MPDKKIKPLNSKVLSYALDELDQHLLPDLHFTSVFRQFLRKELRSKAYLDSQYGFKKFLHVYGVGRTIGAGDECKMKILELLRKYSYNEQPIDIITSLAEKIQKRGLSSNASNGSYGLPRSFCSKLLYIHKPDAIIPFDSYVLRSLEKYSHQKIKTIEQYYSLANEFRILHFGENSQAIWNLREKYNDQFLSIMTSLQLDPDMLFSWKLTDKYLWCYHLTNRT